MAWQDTLLDAKFRGVAFHIQNVVRSGQRAVAAHEFPYRAGADLEDLNLRARRVRVEALVWGDDYEEQLFQLTQALEMPGAGELIHPIHGSMRVIAESWDDKHEADLVDGAVLSIQFIEDSTRELVFSARSASSRTEAVAFKAAAARTAVNMAAQRHLETVKSPARITAIKDAFNQAKKALSNVLKVVGDVKLILSDLEPLLYPQAYFADLQSMVDIAFQGLPFGGRNLIFGGDTSTVASGSGLGDFRRLAVALQPQALPITPPANASAEILLDSRVVQAQLAAQGSTSLAEAAGIVLAGELDTALLDRGDIESMTNQARAALQAAITQARACLDGEGRGECSTLLAQLAYELQEAARAVINQRPPLTRRLSPVAGPLRLVAHVMYGEGERALELARLNRLGRSALVDYQQELLAYAR